MKLPLHLVLAAIALVWAAVLTAGTAFASTYEQKQRALAVHDEAVFKKANREGRVQSEAAKAAHARRVQPEFDRLCTFKGVMSDAEIYGCRLAFKL
jgi:hypothetical protein